ncbi:unnamed protein product [Gongylonema pulchrum]|uniref:Ion_trans_2 domain-containing protein n=1 Tax=Gongylonema pulchrum TaxID=637853 RepID=A0A183CUK2_9BILA|nr:unnamed protein product [Gongylonema pulchrum]
MKIPRLKALVLADGTSKKKSAISKVNMGLQMFQLHNKVIDKIEASPWQIRETNARLGIGLAVLFFYLLIGAVVFVQIEGPAEKSDLETYEEFRSHWDRVLQEAGFEESDVDRLFADIRAMALKGIWTERNITSELNWSFGQAFFFAGALISTVGKRYFSSSALNVNQLQHW